MAMVMAMSSGAEADEQTDRLATATSLFEAGQELVREGRIDAACAKFEESYRLEAANGTLLNLADCYERQGRTATAWLTFRDVAGKSARTGQDKRAEVAQARAERLEPRLVRLRITLAEGAAAGTVVTRDGIELAAPSLGVPVPVDPGLHTVEATAPGHQPWRREITAREEGTLEVVVPALDAEQAPRESMHVLAIGGIVGMALGGGVGLAGLALGIAAKVEADGADCGIDNRCSEPGLQTRADAVTLGNVGTGLGIAGIVLGSAGLVLWLTAPSEDVEIGLGPRGARLRVSF